MRLAQLRQLLLQLEETGGDDTLIRSIFREVHTIKGSSAVAGLEEVSRRAHQLEELVDELRSGRTPTPDVIDTLLAGADSLSELITDSLGTESPVRPPALESRTGDVGAAALGRPYRPIGHSPPPVPAQRLGAVDPPLILVPAG